MTTQDERKTNDLTRVDVDAQPTQPLTAAGNDPDSVVWTIEVFREDDGWYAAEWLSGDSTEAGMGNYSTTPIGALAELCSTLIQVQEDKSAETTARIKAVRAFNALTSEQVRALVGAGTSAPAVCFEFKPPAQAAPHRGGWQPIETVPKDGTEVLIALPDGHVQQCYWSVIAQRWNLNRLDDPTHWQPLPLGPE